MKSNNQRREFKISQHISSSCKVNTDKQSTPKMSENKNDRYLGSKNYCKTAIPGRRRLHKKMNTDDTRKSQSQVQFNNSCTPNFKKLNHFLYTHNSLQKKFESTPTVPNKFSVMTQKINCLNNRQIIPYLKSQKVKKEGENMEGQTEQAAIRGILKMFDCFNSQRTDDNDQKLNLKGKNVQRKIYTSDGISRNRKNGKNVRFDEQIIKKDYNRQMLDIPSFLQGEKIQIFNRTNQKEGNNDIDFEQGCKKKHKDSSSKFKFGSRSLHLTNFSIAEMCNKIWVGNRMKNNLIEEESKFLGNIKYDKIKRDRLNNDNLNKKVKDLERKAILKFGIDFKKVKRAAIEKITQINSSSNIQCNIMRMEDGNKRQQMRDLGSQQEKTLDKMIKKGRTKQYYEERKKRIFGEEKKEDDRKEVQSRKQEREKKQKIQIMKDMVMRSELGTQERQNLQEQILIEEILQYQQKEEKENIHLPKNKKCLDIIDQNEKNMRIGNNKSQNSIQIKNVFEEKVKQVDYTQLGKNKHKMKNKSNETGNVRKELKNEDKIRRNKQFSDKIMQKHKSTNLTIHHQNPQQTFIPQFCLKKSLQQTQLINITNFNTSLKKTHRSLYIRM